MFSMSVNKMQANYSYAEYIYIVVPTYDEDRLSHDILYMVLLPGIEVGAKDRAQAVKAAILT